MRPALRAASVPDAGASPPDRPGCDAEPRTTRPASEPLELSAAGRSPSPCDDASWPTPDRRSVERELRDQPLVRHPLEQGDEHVGGVAAVGEAGLAGGDRAVDERRQRSAARPSRRRRRRASWRRRSPRSSAGRRGRGRRRAPPTRRRGAAGRVANDIGRGSPTSMPNVAAMAGQTVSQQNTSPFVRLNVPPAAAGDVAAQRSARRRGRRRRPRAACGASRCPGKCSGSPAARCSAA